MRLLYLTQLLPMPLDAGPKLRSHYVLRYLAEAGYDVTVVCFVRAEDKAEDIAVVRRTCRRLETIPILRSRLRDVSDGLRTLTGEVPFLVRRDQQPAMERMVQDLCGSQSFDVIHSDQLWMAPYALANGSGPRTVLDQHNAVYMVMERLAQQQRNPLMRAWCAREANKLKAFEQRTCASFDRVVWVTKEDKQALRNNRLPAPDARKESVIPIATDPSRCLPISRVDPFRVTFLGGMHWPPNAEGVRWFTENVWPMVSARVPGAVLTLIGKRPPNGLPSSSKIEVAGYVNNPEQYLRETAAFIVPLWSGAGMRVKILDAWCWGLPIISTTLGAEGTKFEHDTNMLIGDTAAEFAEGVIRVLQNPQTARRLGGNGRATAEQHYDWRKVYPAWEQVYH